MLLTLGPFLSSIHSWLYYRDDVGVSNALSICRICPLDLAKGPFSEHLPLDFVVTLLLGKMLDVAGDGPHRGKLYLLCQRW